MIDLWRQQWWRDAISGSAENFMTNTEDTSVPETEVRQRLTQMDFMALLWPVISARFAIAVLMFVGFVFGVIYLHLAPRTYQATLLVTQADTQQKTGLSDLLGKQASSLLSLRRGSPSGANDTFALYLDGLKTRAVAERLMRDKALVQKLFGDEYDPATGQWHEPPPGVASVVETAAYSILGFPVQKWKPPSAETMATYLNNNITTDVDPTDPMVQIHVTMGDPALAVELLEKLHKASDDYLKEQFLTRTESYISYLSARLSGDASSDLRKALIDNLSDQERTHMMASSSLSFTAQKFGDAFVSDRPASPRPVRTLGSVLALMFVLGTGLALAGPRWFLRFNERLAAAAHSVMGILRRKSSSHPAVKKI